MEFQKEARTTLFYSGWLGANITGQNKIATIMTHPTSLMPLMCR